MFWLTAKIESHHTVGLVPWVGRGPRVHTLLHSNFHTVWLWLMSSLIPLASKYCVYLNNTDMCCCRLTLVVMTKCVLWNSLYQLGLWPHCTALDWTVPYCTELCCTYCIAVGWNTFDMQKAKMSALISIRLLPGFYLAVNLRPRAVKVSCKSDWRSFMEFPTVRLQYLLWNVNHETYMFNLICGSTGDDCDTY